MWVEAGIHRASAEEIRASRAAYLSSGWRVFVVPEGIDSKEQFFDQARATFPLDPPLINFVSDALDDSLWEGLDALPESKVAILWPDALTLADADPAAYETAVSIFSGLTQSLRDPALLGGGSPTTVAAVLGG